MHGPDMPFRGRRWFLAMVLAPSIGWAAPAAAQGFRRPAPSAGELAALGLAEKRISVAGQTRHYLERPPRDAGRPAAVVVLLHGGTQSMRRLFALNAGGTRAWLDVAQRENILLLVPNATQAGTGDAASDQQTWNDLRPNMRGATTADDVGFIRALLDQAARAHRVDPGRVYVTGASNGGMMTYRLLMEMPERFTAAAAFIAALPAADDQLKQPSRPTPLMIVAGTEDPLIKWAGGPVAFGRGQTRAMVATAAWWIAANRADKAAARAERLPDLDRADGCTLERQDVPARPGGAPVAFVTMRGGGHAMPSVRYKIPDGFLVRRFIGTVCRDVEGAELAWAFLSAHRSR